MGGREGRERREGKEERERGRETPDLDLDFDTFTIGLPSRIFLKIGARTRF